MSAPEPPWIRRTGPQRKRRPPILSRERITRAAIDLADAEGLDAVSTRRLAAAMGVGPSSMYWHVAAKEDLYELMVDEVIGEIVPAPPTGDWMSDLRAIAVQTLDAFRRHRWIAEIGIQPGLGPYTQRYARAALEALEGLTEDLETRVNVLATLNNYLVGFAQREAAWARLQLRAGLGDDEFAAELRDFAARVAAQDEVTAEQMMIRFRLRSDEALAFGLDCLVKGVAELVERSSVSKRRQPG